MNLGVSKNISTIPIRNVHNEVGSLSRSNVSQLAVLPVVETEDSSAKERYPILTLRLVTLIVLVAALTMHVRSLRVFRWEQSVSGGVLVTYCVAVTGLALCAGAHKNGGKASQAFLCSTGAALLLVNAGAIWRRWQHSGELTQVVAELLIVLGVPLRRQVLIKVILSTIAAIALMLDLGLVPIMTAIKKEH